MPAKRIRVKVSCDVVNPHFSVYSDGTITSSGNPYPKRGTVKVLLQGYRSEDMAYAAAQLCDHLCDYYDIPKSNVDLSQ